MIGLAHDGEEDISKDTSSRFSSGPRIMNKGFPMTSIYTFLCRKGDERRMEKRQASTNKKKYNESVFSPSYHLGDGVGGEWPPLQCTLAEHGQVTRPTREGCLPSHFSDLYFLSLFPFSLIISFYSSLLSLSFS